MRRTFKITARVEDVVMKIEDRIYNDALAEKLIEKVKKYSETKNPADDLTLQESGLIYRDDDYGVEVPISNRKDAEIGWSNHSEYRSDLRDIDPKLVNRDIAEHLKKNLAIPKHRKDTLKKPEGTIVVDWDTTSSPARAEIITVWASRRVASEFPTFRELQNQYAELGEHHHLRMVCVKCGNAQTCRCSSPKVEVEGICDNCSGAGKIVANCEQRSHVPGDMENPELTCNDSDGEKQKEVGCNCRRSWAGSGLPGASQEDMTGKSDERIGVSEVPGDWDRKSYVSMDHAMYRHDPQHHNRPNGGMWRRTENGWSQVPLNRKDKVLQEVK